jgi:hypothetical protein
VTSSRAAEPDLSRADLGEALVEDNTGVPRRFVSLALTYWADYLEEIDALVAHAERLEDEALRAAEKTTELLGR